jgi:hypothetical protein
MLTCLSTNCGGVASPLGGMSTPIELDAILHGTVEPTAHQYSLIAVALNKYFVEFDPSRFIPYMEDVRSPN